MITINKQQLKEFGACEAGFKRFISSTDNTEYDIDVIDLIGSDVTTDDLLWLAGKILQKKKIAQFAVDCAESVVHLSENKEAHHNCIDAANAVIENDNIYTRDAANAARDAATYAATYAATCAATYVAIYAVRATVYHTTIAAGDAARDAAYAAGDADDNFDVKPLLVKLFTK